MPKKDVELEVKTEVKPIEKKLDKSSYKAYAEFEFRRKTYKADDSFVPDQDLKLDPGFIEFRTHANKKGREQRGIAFTYDVTTEGKDSMGGGIENIDTRRTILPVE